MLINQKRIPILIKSVEDLIKEFPGARDFINNNSHLFMDEAIDSIENSNDMNVLHRLCISFFKRSPKHYSIMALTDKIIITECDMRFILTIGNSIFICISELHKEEMYINKVFMHYALIDTAITRIEQKDRNFDMAQSIHRRIGGLDIRFLEG